MPRLFDTVTFACRALSLPRKRPTFRYRVDATVKMAKVVYIRTFIDTPGDFVQVMMWAQPSHVQDAMPDFEVITGSVKAQP